MLGLVVDAAQVAREHRGYRPGAIVGVMLADVVPERAQQLDGVIESAPGVVVKACEDADGKARGVGDPERARRRGGGPGERDIRKRRHAVAPGAGGVGGDVVKQRRVGDASGEQAVDGQAVPGVLARRDGHPSALGLEPEQAAPCRGDADRPGAVGAERCADQPGGDGDGAAAAGASGRTLRVPWVASCSERGRLGERPDHQLGHIRLAYDHGAGLAQLAYDLGVG